MLRLQKSLSERIYLLYANQTSTDDWNFRVRGQSLNVYNQEISPKRFYCSCPDHKTRGSFCKHLLFLIGRVGQRNELALKIHQNPKSWNNTIFNECSTSWVNRLSNRIEKPKEKVTKEGVIGSDCPICFEEMKENDDLTSCLMTCGNYFHKGCIDLWLSSGHSTCALCRSEWVIFDNTDNYMSCIEVKLLESNLDDNAGTAVETAVETAVATTTEVISDQPSEVVLPEQHNNDFDAPFEIITCNPGKIKDNCQVKNICTKNKELFYEYVNSREYIDVNREVVVYDKRDRRFKFGMEAKLLVFHNNEGKERLNINGDFHIFIHTIASKQMYAGQRLIII